MKNLIVSALAVASIAGAASAAVESFSFNFGPTAVPFSGNGNLSLFDTMGGTRVLIGVNVSYMVTLGANVVATSNAGPQIITVGVSGSAAASDGIFNRAGPINGNAVSPILNNGDVFNFGSVSGSDTFAAALPAFFFPAYTGVGTFVVNYSGSGLFGIVGQGNAQLDVSAFEGFGKVQIDYTWREVPAPGAAALLGLSGLVALRRRR